MKPSAFGLNPAEGARATGCEARGAASFQPPVRLVSRPVSPWGNAVTVKNHFHPEGRGENGFHGCVIQEVDIRASVDLYGKSTYFMKYL
jgi:hypothetical protein